MLTDIVVNGNDEGDGVTNTMFPVTDRDDVCLVENNILADMEKIICSFLPKSTITE